MNRGRLNIYRMVWPARIACVVAASTLSISTARAQVTGSETAAGASKPEACAAAKNAASRSATRGAELAKARAVDPSATYVVKVEGCICEVTTAGYSTSTVCSADWTVNFETKKSR